MKIGVALINWNNAGDTLDCIDSLGRGRRVPDHIVVWDNHSGDDSLSRIRASHPDMELVASPENVGFACACNEAAALLIERGSDAVWILNNDTRVEEDCLSILEQGLVHHPEVAAVTGKILYDHDRQLVWYAGGQIRPHTLTSVHLGQDLPDQGSNETAGTISFMSGCSMLIRSDVVTRLGLFDPAFFAYCEDLDWSLRLQAVGQALLYIPGSRLYHKVSASVRRNDRHRGSSSPLQHFLTARNQLFVIRRHAPGCLARWSGLIAFSGQRLYFAAANMILGRPTKVAAILRGLWQGLFHPLPPTPRGITCSA